MGSLRQESSDSCDLNGADSTHRHARPADEAAEESRDTARLGVVACILFMAGGLYWTASVGLLTMSALTAYPLMISVGIVLILVIFGATFWTPQGLPSDTTLGSLLNASPAGDMHTYDSVTGLPTHRLFTALLTQALSRAQKHGRQVAVLMIELDHFAPEADGQAGVNSNLMYRIQAARVKSALRTTDTVARLAESTFVVLLDRVTVPDEVAAIATKMQATISLPITLDGHELFLSSRIGISLSACDGGESGALLDAASHAILMARAEGCSIYGLHGIPVAPFADGASTIAA